MNNKTNSINVITFLRLQKGMTRAELAAATGLKPMDITRAERGDMPSLAKYVKLRAFLNISLDILMRNDFARLIESFTVPIKALHRLSLKLDSTNAKNSALGRSGEDYVYEHERNLGYRMMGKMLGISHEEVRQICMNPGVPEKYMAVILDTLNIAV